MLAQQLFMGVRGVVRAASLSLMFTSACFANVDGTPEASLPGTTGGAHSSTVDVGTRGASALNSCANLTGPCNPNLETVPLTGCAISDYSANVTLDGNQTFMLIMDSGSTTVGVAAASCTNCTGISPEYNTVANATNLNKSVSSTYGDGSGWRGTAIADEVSVGQTGARIAFAAITSQNMAKNARNFFSSTYCTGVAKDNTNQGIFGLAGARIALPNTDAFLDKVVTPDKADAFAFQACDMNGNMWLGGYNPNFISAGPAFTPMDTSSGFYEITVSDVSVGGKSAGLTAAAFGTTIADTGTSITLIPQTAFDAIVKLVESDQNYLDLFGAGFIANGTSCTPPGKAMSKAQLDALLPTMTLVLPNTTGGQVSVQLPATESYLTPSFTPSGADCYYPALGSTGALSNTGPSTIIGNAAMHSHVVIFDRANNQLGFAPQAGCQ